MKVNFDEKHVKWGVTIFLVILCSIIVFFAIYRMRDVSEVINVILAILTPFIYGLVMAYLLCPVYNFTSGGRTRFLTAANGRYRVL